MKLTINTGSIANAAARVKSAVDSRASLAALGCILLTAKGDGLTLRASNLDTEIEITLPAEVSEDGAIAIPSRTFCDALAMMPGDSELRIECDDKHVAIVTQGARRLRLPGLKPGEFPAKPAQEGKAQDVHFAEGELSDLFGKLAPFMSTDPTRWVLCGVCLSGQEGHTNLVATSGKILRLIKIPAKFKGSAIIPADAVAKARSLSDGQSVVAKVYESGCVFEGDGWKLSTKLVEGEFPTYLERTKLREETPKRIEFGRSAMLSELRFCGIIGDATDVIKFRASEDRCALSLISRTGAETSSEVQDAKGDAPETAYDAKALKTVVESVSDDFQTLFMDNEISPGIVNDATGFALLLPCRVA